MKMPMFKHTELGSNADLAIGDTVRLSKDTDWNITAIVNPLEVDGTVEDIDSHWVYVVWSNTWLRNSYKLKDSDLIKQ
jgi:hypothetical protein